MKKLLAGLLLGVLIVLAVSCGGSAATEDTTSPSASPSPSPTVLTDAGLLTQFLAAVKPIRVRFRKLENAVDHVVWKDANQNVIDASWPRAGHRAWKLTKRYDGIMVDLQLIDVPAFMRPAMKSLLKGLRIERKMYDNIGTSLVNKESWGNYTSDGKLYEKLQSEAADAFDAWRIKAKLEAKRYGVKIPWKWTKP